MKTFSFLEDWVPKSRCIFTGNMIRVPQWIVKNRCKKQRGELKRGSFADFSALEKKADALIGSRPTPPWELKKLREQQMRRAAPVFVPPWERPIQG